MARGDRVIANSQYTADLIRQRHGTKDERLRVVYRGVDVKGFARDAISNERMDRLRASWGITKGQKIILHPARLTRWKGQGVVIDAMKKLMQNGKDNGATAILAGDHQGREDYVRELQQKIKDHGLSERVVLVGHCSDMAAAYALAHVTIIASIEPEAFGRTSAEAQAIGCPVIATDIGAPPETVRAIPFVRESETTGWLVPPDQPDELASALTKVLALNEGAYRELSARAVDNASQHFSDQLMKMQTLVIYDELLGTDFAGKMKQIIKKEPARQSKTTS